VTRRIGARLWWGVPVLLVLLWATGLLVVASFPGLPTPPAYVLWLEPVGRYARDIASMLALGSLIVGGLLTTSRRAREWAMGWSLIWFAVLAVLLVLTISDVRAIPPIDALGTAPGFLLDDYVGRVFLAQFIGIIAFALLLPAAGRRGVAWTAAIIGTAACIAPSFLGHGGLSGAHVSATISLGIHIGAVSLWVGGLAAVIALVHVQPDLGPTVLPRFSLMALWCVLIIAESGLLNATLRVGSISLFVGTLYGSLVILKAALLAWLIRLGWMQRKRAMPEAMVGSTAVLTRFASREFLVMATAIAVSVVLSRIGPPHGTLATGAFSPLAIIALGLVIPALLAWSLPRPAWLTRLSAYPEVPAMALLVVVAEVAGLGLLNRWLGLELGLGLGSVLLVAVGWIATACLFGSRGMIGIVILMIGWPIAIVLTASLSPTLTSWQMNAVSIALAEAILVAIALRGRSRTPAKEPAHAQA
jgi:putative copper export protein